MSYINLTYLESQVKRVADSVNEVDSTLIDNLQEVVRQQQANTEAILLLVNAIEKIGTALNATQQAQTQAIKSLGTLIEDIDQTLMDRLPV